jgi:hypothetical protein
MNGRAEFEVPCLHVPNRAGFDVCWAGPSPLGRGFSFGSTDGKILFVDENGLALHGMQPWAGSYAREAVNGIVRAGTRVVVSTRADVNFWPVPGAEGGDLDGWVSPYGVHGVGTTVSGHIIAPMGRNGIMVVAPPHSGDTAPTALIDAEEGLYVYRVIGLRSDTGTEAIACAARTAGIVAGEFSGPDTAHRMKTAAFNGLDVIDICALGDNRNGLAVAALSVDGTIILFRDVLQDEQPLTMKFRTVQGTAYRVLSYRGELFVLTSQGLFVLGKLADRFLARELQDGVVTQILPMRMQAVDAHIAERSLLVVMPDEVLRFDADWIHNNVPEDVANRQSEEYQSAVVRRDWHSALRTPTARRLQVA